MKNSFAALDSLIGPSRVLPRCCLVLVIDVVISSRIIVPTFLPPQLERTSATAPRRRPGRNLRRHLHGNPRRHGVRWHSVCNVNGHGKNVSCWIRVVCVDGGSGRSSGADDRGRGGGTLTEEEVDGVTEDIAGTPKSVLGGVAVEAHSCDERGEE